MTLTQIANKHNTDKGTIAYEAHGYTEEYSKYIPNIGKYTLLEIGVWHGDSMKMWLDYNPDLVIHGVDIDKNVLNYIDNNFDSNLYIHIGDVNNQSFLEDVLIDCDNELDFIIDDGSHYYSDILESFKLLYSHLKEGGYYFIEDLHTSQSERHRLIDEIVQLYPFKNLGFRCNGKLWIIQKP